MDILGFCLQLGSFWGGYEREYERHGVYRALNTFTKIHLRLKGKELAAGSWKCHFSGHWERIFLLQTALGVGHSPSPGFITGIFPTFDVFPLVFGVFF